MENGKNSNKEDMVDKLLRFGEERKNAVHGGEDTPKFLKVIVKITKDDGFLMIQAANEIKDLRNKLEGKYSLSV